jgi:HupE / UreJ protein
MRLSLICVALTGALVAPALAHTGAEQTNSFAAGIAHPLNGADHILAMVAVGLWAVLAGGRAIWVWPTAFVATMLAGFAAATLGLQIPFVEPAIWSSVIILGLFVALAVKAPVWLAQPSRGSSHSFTAMPMGPRSQRLVSFLMRRGLLSPPLGFMQLASGSRFSSKARSGRSRYAPRADLQCWSEWL